MRTFKLATLVGSCHIQFGFQVWDRKARSSVPWYLEGTPLQCVEGRSLCDSKVIQLAFVYAKPFRQAGEVRFSVGPNYEGGDEGAQFVMLVACHLTKYTL
jgi:hypothetical protein